MRNLIFTLLSLALLTNTLRGAEITVSTDPMAVSIQREPANGKEPIFRAFITVGENKLTFIIPEKFSTSGDPAHGRLQFKTLDGDSFITLYFVRSESSGLTPEACRSLLSERYPGCKIVKEFNRPVAGRSANAFEAQWKSAQGFAMATRAVYFPTPCGNVELTITTAANKFMDTRSVFNEVLGTFAASVDGKLVVRRVGGPS